MDFLQLSCESTERKLAAKDSIFVHENRYPDRKHRRTDYILRNENETRVRSLIFFEEIKSKSKQRNKKGRNRPSAETGNRVLFNQIYIRPRSEKRKIKGLIKRKVWNPFQPISMESSV